MNNFDVCTSFHIANGAFRGRLIRLNNVLDTILGKHGYPKPVSAVIAESSALAAILASSIKYDGLFTLQTESNGPVSMVVVDICSDGTMRACAKFDEKHLEHSQALRKTSGEIEAAPHLMGEGRLAFTVDQGADTQLYQGIVELRGKNLSECALRYFKQSEQIETALQLFLLPPQGDSQSWSAAGIMIQKMPDEGGKTSVDADEAEEAWNQAQIFMHSLTADEIFNADLTAEELLTRLYHSDNLIITKTQEYKFGCRCSREKLLKTLRSFSKEEMESMVENNKITADCRFCSEKYIFDKGEIIEQ